MIPGASRPARDRGPLRRRPPHPLHPVGPGARPHAAAPAAGWGDRRIGLLLSVLGAVGWLASFRLGVDQWHLLKDPGFQPACNISPVVGCGNVISSWQGSVFGFPNTLLGLGVFAAVLTLGIILVTGSRVHRSVWLMLNAGTLCGVVMVHWLIQQSLYELGRLCPYCMVVWVVTIALFWYVTLHNLKRGTIPLKGRGRRVIDVLTAGHWAILTVWYAAVSALVLVRFLPYWSTLL